MSAHNPAEVVASLHCSILQPDSYVPGTAKIVVELCLAHQRTGNWPALVAAATATASDTAVLVGKPVAVATEPVVLVAERIAEHSTVPAGGQGVEPGAQPVAESTPAPRSVLSSEHRIRPATVVVDVLQSLAALHCFEVLLFSCFAGVREPPWHQPIPEHPNH